jgi:glycosyltransferase involved in cell wall biosynthesis
MFGNLNDSCGAFQALTRKNVDTQARSLGYHVKGLPGRRKNRILCILLNAPSVISFIIPAYNEEQLLARTLTSIHDAAKPLGARYEIVVANDASTDRTAAIAEQQGARVITVNHRQIAATRNSGGRASAGDVLIFVDADTIVNSAAVSGAIEAIKTGAIGGGCAFRFDGMLPLYARIMALVAIPIYRHLRLASGCFLFCTRAAFDGVGGFDEKLFGAEELAMSRALGRYGRFVILRQYVTTSGRKVRAYSGREILGFLLRMAFTGRTAVRQRQGLDLWYGPRRQDPESPSS